MSNNSNYDTIILGAGLSGTVAAYKIAKEHKNIKCLMIDLGSPPAKRRRQLEGYMGCTMASDGKLYLNDIDTVSDVSGVKPTKAAYKWLKNEFGDVLDFKVIKDKSPGLRVLKKIEKSGFDFSLNNHIQLFPKEIHLMSKFTSNIILNAKNMDCSFNNEIFKISKNKNIFTVHTYYGDYNCKKIIVATGRSGWRWAHNLYKQFGIVKENNTAKFGVRIEADASCFKDWNGSNCSMKNKDIELGPLSWNGTVIPEDHLDFATSAFRSNEGRWESEKVSFNLIGNRFFEGNGIEQMDRLGQLTFILTNDRVIKEKVSTVLSNKSCLSIIPEYNWVGDAVRKVGEFMPDVLTKAYFHVPTIFSSVSKIHLNKDLSTNHEGIYSAGEAAGTHGLLSAMLTGTIVADTVCE